MGGCRNCGSTDVQDHGFIGEVAPFFLKRVLHLEIGFPASSHPLRRLFRGTRILRQVFWKLFHPAVLIELQTCNACTFLQTKNPFSDEAIKSLYLDYRSASYNQERIQYEPSYARLADHIGIDKKEVQNRVTGITAWLSPKLDIKGAISILDYGGADGGFLPDLTGDKYVFEVSDITPVPGVTRIESERLLGSYSYIQLGHILEHVSYPLAFLKHVCSYLDDSGFVYVEVPQEIDEAMLAKLRSGTEEMSIGIHEHINRYTPRAITALLEAAGLKPISVEAEVFDFSWMKQPIIRGLARKVQS